MTIKAVIFDLDGVIVSTDHYHYRAWKALADQEGIYFDEIINNRLRGVSRMESLEIILERANKSYSEAEKLELATHKNNIYVALLDQLSKEDILPNATALLHELKQGGYKIAIGSSSKNAQKILKQVGLFDTFDAIADGTDVTRSKPHPDVFLVAAEKLGIEPNVCAVVEDAEAGIIAAKNANMFAIAVGAATDSRLTDAKANDLIEIKQLMK
jgi:beta-phosphoglucomutase